MRVCINLVMSRVARRYVMGRVTIGGSRNDTTAVINFGLGLDFSQCTDRRSCRRRCRCYTREGSNSSHFTDNIVMTSICERCLSVDHDHDTNLVQLLSPHRKKDSGTRGLCAPWPSYMLFR